MTEFRLSATEARNFLIGSLMVWIAYTGFKHPISLRSAAVYMVVSVLVLGVREIGQRAVADWMEAHVTLELSLEGSATTVFGALASFLSGLSLVFLFPVSNKHSIKRYEQWGKSIDAMWLKRRSWIVGVGVLALIVSGFVFSVLKLPGAELFFLFGFFQMLPFDYPRIPTGELDGATIIKQSGFVWWFFMGLILLGLGFLWF